MIKEVILTPLAEKNYENIIEYLIANWDKAVAINFIKRFEEVAGYLITNPGIFPFVNNKKKIQNAC